MKDSQYECKFIIDIQRRRILMGNMFEILLPRCYDIKITPTLRYKENSSTKYNNTNSHLGHEFER